MEGALSRDTTGASVCPVTRVPAAEWHLRSLPGNADATRPDVLVAAWAGEDWGVLSLAELRACGLSRKAVMWRVRAGWLHPLHRTVYAVGHPNVSIEGRLLAAVKACGPGAVASHFSAAVLWGLMRWDGRRPEVLVASRSTRRHPGLRVHRTARLEFRDVARRRCVPVTSPARTLVDIASMLGPRPLRRAVREAQAQRIVALPHIVEALSRLGPCRGSAKLAAIVATGPAPTRSELEDVVLDLLLRGGLQHPHVNVPLLLGGRRVIPDFRWAARRVVVEADGAAWHENRLAREDDAARQAVLEAHGERVVRVTWQQAVGRPAETIARIRAAGAPSG